MWMVAWHGEALRELAKLPAGERVALDHAVDKLTALGPKLPFPHSSSIRGTAGEGSASCAHAAVGARGARSTDGTGTSL